MQAQAAAAAVDAFDLTIVCQDGPVSVRIHRQQQIIHLRHQEKRKTENWKAVKRFHVVFKRASKRPPL
jgi:hypothetical protein